MREKGLRGKLQAGFGASDTGVMVRKVLARLEKGLALDETPPAREGGGALHQFQTPNFRRAPAQEGARAATRPLRAGDTSPGAGGAVAPGDNGRRSPLPAQGPPVPTRLDPESKELAPTVSLRGQTAARSVCGARAS